jgi:rubrerythrin
MRDAAIVVQMQTNNLTARIEARKKLEHRGAFSLLTTHEQQTATVDGACYRCPRCGTMVVGLFPGAFLCATCTDEFREYDKAREPLMRWFSDLLKETK